MRPCAAAAHWPRAQRPFGPSPALAVLAGGPTAGERRPATAQFSVPEIQWKRAPDAADLSELSVLGVVLPGSRSPGHCTVDDDNSGQVSRRCRIHPGVGHRGPPERIVRLLLATDPCLDSHVARLRRSSDVAGPPPLGFPWLIGILEGMDGIMADRWVTGWVVLPGADPATGGPLAHRPDPDEIRSTMCRRAVQPAVAVQFARPDDIKECGRCAAIVGSARKKRRKDHRSSGRAGLRVELGASRSRGYRWPAT